MTLLHFQPIQGRSLDIIDTILKNEEVAPVNDAWAKMSVVVEEIVLNIVDYAGSDYLDVEIIRDEESISLRFRDGGVPFNPLEKEDPDFTVPFEDRKIGGLGIYMVVNYMDKVTYDYAGGENILTVMKKIKCPTITARGFYS
jgi:anti-sigma regulatory factor (Ser/Thr protein kinase)